MLIPFVVVHARGRTQSLQSISAEKNSTILFPLPIDLLSYFVNRDKKKGS
jgi:hypothetical protein